MISKAVNELIRVGQPLYKISAQKKSCKIGLVVAKLGPLSRYMLVAEFDDGKIEFVAHINGVETDKQTDPGWYVMF